MTSQRILQMLLTILSFDGSLVPDFLFNHHWKWSSRNVLQICGSRYKPFCNTDFLFLCLHSFTNTSWKVHFWPKKPTNSLVLANIWTCLQVFFKYSLVYVPLWFRWVLNAHLLFIHAGAVFGSYSFFINY